MNPVDKTLAEIHAYKFTLSWLLKHKRKRELKLAVKIVENLSAPLPQNVDAWIKADQAATFYLHIGDDINHKKWKKTAEEIIDDFNSCSCHTNAAKYTMKLKLWQRCLDYIA